MALGNRESNKRARMDDGHDSDRSKRIRAGDGRPVGHQITAHRVTAQREVAGTTSRAINKIQGNLTAALHSVTSDRVSMARLWEADMRMRDPATMEQLNDLNQALLLAEDGLNEAVASMRKISIKLS